jgi:hypothetical protein
MLAGFKGQEDRYNMGLKPSGLQPGDTARAVLFRSGIVLKGPAVKQEFYAVVTEGLGLGSGPGCATGAPVLARRRISQASVPTIPAPTNPIPA